ncbi:cilia- and flagella-associated protein 299 isoform X2 [Aplysia californica]|uniref:Cilia- and flagella-associated protein 299 n=1 Tax=Aplysia californica TaxID=6500 RepID=A0ABM0JP54_APLCA|nr:cilia- and flagella-associated protein 299 isoform X1 [Aplysia californica]XP_005098258.1 cilia- and flagella-associated protein 299 isoform X2 [Aplysia californica]
MDEEDLAPGGKSVAEYATYEDFLSSQVTELDMFYLEDVNMARKLVELGYRGAREGFSREQFEATKAAIEAKKQAARQMQKHVFSAGKEFEDGMLRALQQREEANRTGKQASIFFIRDYNEFGQEISGYVDYSHRLATEDFEPIFNLRKKFLPKQTDLSFFNWETMRVMSKNSPNYEVIAKSPNGMLFRNRRDSKIVNVDPYIYSPGDNSSRTVVSTKEYISVVIFDHYNRRKT